MAITNEATIRVRIDGKDAEVSVKDMGKAIETAMKRGKVEADKLKTSFTKIGDAAQRFYFSFQSLRIFIRGAADFVRASNEQEVAVAGFEQAMRSMGRYTEDFSGKLQDLARQIQTEGVIGDEAIMEGTKFLATYKDITNETLPRAMRIMADLAALMGGDMRSAANMLGKASMGMVGELRRAGITISETTMKSKDFNDILREIEEQVGGQNKALAATSAGGMRQFANAWGDLKEQIGTVLKQFMIPFTQMLKPLVEQISKTDKSLMAMVGTLGLVSIAFVKLIPLIKSFGVTSKLALGWIGIIAIVLAELYTAWVTNFDGMQESVRNLWDVMVQFYEKAKDWSKLLIDMFKSASDVIKMILTGKIKDFQTAIAVFFASLGAKLDVEFKKIENKFTAANKLNIPKIENAGKEAGEAFASGFEKGMLPKLPNRFQEWADFVKGQGKYEPKFIDKIYEIAGKGKSPFWEMMDMMKEFGDITQNTFQAIYSSFQSLSDRLTQALFNTKTQFKDIWKSMAMDFTRIFVNYILGQLAQFAAIKLAGAIGLNLIAPGAGMLAANSFSPGLASGGNNTALLQEITGLRSDLKGGAPVVINNRITGNQLYEGMRSGRERDLIRRGKEINNNLF